MEATKSVSGHMRLKLHRKHNVVAFILIRENKAVKQTATITRHARKVRALLPEAMMCCPLGHVCIINFGGAPQSKKHNWFCIV